MPQRLIDLRSDTVTRPTPGMWQAMTAAELGDDVLGEDPTVNRLQDHLANLLGKEAALFVPTGTMSNQIGVRVHCGLGDEALLEAHSHVYLYEQAGAAQLSGVGTRVVEGELGVVRLEQWQALWRQDNIHFPRTRLLCLENTHNRGAGRIQPYDLLADTCAWAHEQGWATHLDGARLFNAVVATGIPARQWAQHFDTVSVCFSKGLGAPVGSALAGSREQIARALRHRKVLGGGMRQAGVIAAAALYALEHHIGRMADDHRRAAQLGDAIRTIDGLRLRGDRVDTNIVIFHVAPALGTAADFAARLKSLGVLSGAISRDSVRLVTHLDLVESDIPAACDALRAAAAEAQQGRAGEPVGAARAAYG